MKVSNPAPLPIRPSVTPPSVQPGKEHRMATTSFTACPTEIVEAPVDVVCRAQGVGAQIFESTGSVFRPKPRW
jgi:hypothetical protein